MMVMSPLPMMTCSTLGLSETSLAENLTKIHCATVLPATYYYNHYHYYYFNHYHYHYH